jgi:hypothetical protein
MFLKVCLRNNSQLRAGLFFGRPASRVQSEALFAEGALFGYVIETARFCRAYLCRWTLSGADRVPGVDHPVDILCFAPNRTKLAKLQNVLGFLMRNQVPLQDSPEAFWTRVNGLLEDSRTTCRTLRHIARSHLNHPGFSPQ